MGEPTWLEKWQSASEAWLEGDRGSLVVSSTKVTKVLSENSWRITGIKFVEWDRSMPIPVAQVAVDLVSQMRVRLDAVLQHTALTGEPWPTSIFFEPRQAFTFMGVEDYMSCEILIDVYWERTVGVPLRHEIYKQIGAAGVA